MFDVSDFRTTRARRSSGLPTSRRHRTAVLASAVALGLLTAFVSAVTPTLAD